MKQPWECKCTMDGGKITRLTSGNTAIRPDRWSLTSGLAGSGKVRSGSWVTSKACCKATVTALTIISVAQSSCTPRAGRMPDEVLRCSQTQAQRYNLDSDRGADG